MRDPKVRPHTNDILGVVNVVGFGKCFDCYAKARLAIPLKVSPGCTVYVRSTDLSKPSDPFLANRSISSLRRFRALSDLRRIMLPNRSQSLFCS
jgi:hypothetical protein